ncbi:RecF/RecN/SMC N terminal domain-containing protein [Cantharellus anzutake]|uniref:RecF/RecN/SMC N terminal domain-containing protein n=1 Tax=Cantharellus anzutake TaxID=1750568 RepID=UPI00190393F5|nr:RecF/RecN/SMC N terminal domain-containing protein [Cantharellus anzutake]KAF8316702.1 RecF/RecN/SMC N terminal domain-containing protein [Cantharellus anzutake]
MHIKTLTIHGFKSYRDQTAIEPFSPSHNVVVGRNGSGKSNFFSAIRFVLSDAYTSMSREERGSLLHEGVSVTTTLSAYVEIIFDNSDNRFPTGKDEVILRRTIGLKKDEYSLDKKSATKADVMNLLESAGFSRSNPYYIVPQGRITSLTNAKDHERLALLKEVAGTNVYENRRAESLKLMEETESKRSKIKESLTFIEERLQELEEEKEELKEYQEKDKERRCLEYAMYQRELGEVGQMLEEIEINRRKEIDDSNEKRNEFAAREKEIEVLKDRISSLESSLSVLALSKHGLTNEMQDLLKARTELECIIEDLGQAGQKGAARKKGLKRELNEVEKQISGVETELMEVVPEWEDRVAKEKEARASLDRAQASLDTLYAKQGRISRFKSRTERDMFLRNEIDAIAAHEKSQAQVKANMQTELTNTLKTIDELIRKGNEIEENLNERRGKLQEMQEEVNNLQHNLREKTEQRKEMWREDAKLSQLKNNAQQQLREAERNLASTMDKEVA